MFQNFHQICENHSGTEFWLILNVGKIYDEILIGKKLK